MLKVISDQKEQWQNFVQTHAPRSGAFLQSWEWGTFQEATGKKVHRFAWVEGEAWKAVAQTSEIPLPFGQKYAYIARGPILTHLDLQVNLLNEIGRELRVSFVRADILEPIAGSRIHQTFPVSPPDTLITPLDQTTEERQAQMHQKTRYNIRVAEKKGVTVDLAQTTFTDDMWSVFKTTAARGQFRIHDRAHYEKMLKALAGSSVRAYLATASYQDQVVAANLMIDFGDTRTYLHGASSDQHRNVMAPYLLHERLIEDAKEKGMKFYDWWGVSPEGAMHHPWAGVTRFKLGFGGERLSYPGTYDVICQPLPYHFYRIARAAMRKIA